YSRQKWLAASVCLGLACLTRFESWLACPVLMFAYAQRKRFQPGRLIQSLILFGWAPLTWIVFRQGLSPSGSFVLDHSISNWRFERWAFLAWMTVRYTPIPTLLLASVGAVLMITRGIRRERSFQLVSAFFLLFLISILFSAHGDQPDPERYVTSRETHIPIALLTLLAAAGFGFPVDKRIALTIWAAGVLLGIYGSYSYVKHETSRPEVRLGYELARYLDRN